MTNSNRRDFMKTTAGLGAAMALSGTLKAHTVAPTAPFPQQYSFCNEVFRDLGWSQEKIFNYLAQCGYKGVEIAPFTINNDVNKITAAERKNLCRYAEKAGLEIVGLHWLLAGTKELGLHLTSPDPDVRKKTSAYLVSLGRFCSDLGGKVMVFGSPNERNFTPKMTWDEGFGYATEVLKRAMPALEKLGIVLALEPLGAYETNFMYCAGDAVKVAKAVGSPSCKIMLDCKAMARESTPILELIKIHAPWTVHFHANDPNFQGPGFGDLDFAPIFQTLKDTKFKGWVSVEPLEYTPGAENLATKSIAYMKKCAEKVS